jgi:hypothetical protein
VRRSVSACDRTSLLQYLGFALPALLSRLTIFLGTCIAASIFGSPNSSALLQRDRRVVQQFARSTERADGGVESRGDVRPLIAHGCDDELVESGEKGPSSRELDKSQALMAVRGATERRNGADTGSTRGLRRYTGWPTMQVHETMGRIVRHADDGRRMHGRILSSKKLTACRQE